MAFRDIFIKPEETPQTQKQKVTPVQAQPEQVIDNSAFVQTTVQTQETTPGATSTAVAGTNMVAALWQSIIDKNLPGPDYLELRNAIGTSKIASLPISEQQKVETAFSMLNMTNPTFTKEVLIRSIETYEGILEEEKSAGLAEVNLQRKQQIDGKKVEIANLNKELSSIDTEIQKLIQQKDTIAKAVQTKTQEIQVSETSINKKENDFLAAVAVVQKTLNDDKNKYQTYNL